MADEHDATRAYSPSRATALLCRMRFMGSKTPPPGRRSSPAQALRSGMTWIAASRAGFTNTVPGRTRAPMPHIIIEHSPLPLDMDALNRRLHARAMQMDALPVGGLRVRNHPVEVARTGDGREGAGFVYVTVRLGRGRSEATRREIGEALMAELESFAQAHSDAHPLSLGLEVEEIAGLTWKRNNIHALLEAEQAGIQGQP